MCIVYKAYYVTRLRNRNNNSLYNIINYSICLICSSIILSSYNVKIRFYMISEIEILLNKNGLEINGNQKQIQNDVMYTVINEPKQLFQNYSF
jgi:hypothetical protein